MKLFFKKNKYFLLLSTVIAFFVGNNVICILLDKTLPVHDACFYYSVSIKLSLSQFHDWLNILSSFHIPPFILLAPQISYYFLGSSVDAAAISLQLFYVLLILAAYGIGRQLKTKQAGLLTAILAAACPINFGMSKCFMQDLLLSALVSLSIYLLLKTEKFKHPLYCFLFGISMALGLLAKATYPVFILVPVTYFLFRSEKTAFKNILLVLLTASAVCGFWYFKNFISCWRNYSSTGNTIKTFSAIIKNVNLGNTQEYIRQLYFYVLGPVYSWFGLGATLYLVLAKQKFKFISLLFLCLLVPYFVFIAISTTILPRYLITLVTFFCLLISVGIQEINSAKLRTMFISILTTLVTVQFLILSYGDWTKSYWLKKIIPWEHISTNPGTCLNYGNFGINIQGLKQEKILNFVNQKQKATVLFLKQELSSESNIVEDTFISACIPSKIKFIRLGSRPEQLANVPHYKLADIKAMILNVVVDYILILESDPWYAPEVKQFNQQTGIYNALKQAKSLYNYFWEYQKNYNLICSTEIYGRKLCLYKKGAANT